MTDPTPTPELDLAALRGWIEAGIRMDKEHALEVIARAEAAEAKIAAVREVVVRDAGYEYTYGGDVILVELVTAALDGTA